MIKPSRLACVTAVVCQMFAPLARAETHDASEAPHQYEDVSFSRAALLAEGHEARGRDRWNRSIVDSTGLPRRPTAVFAVDAGIGVPFGAYYSGTETSLGFALTGHVVISSRFGVRASYARLGIKADSEADPDNQENSDVDIVSKDLEARRIAVGVEFYNRFPGSDHLGARTMSHVHVSACRIRHVTEFAAIVRRSTGESREIRDSFTSTAVGLSLGAGLLRQLNAFLALEFGIDVDTVVPQQVRSLREAVDSHGSVVVVHVGIAVVP